jgi:hypothetical protein
VSASVIVGPTHFMRWRRESIRLGFGCARTSAYRPQCRLTTLTVRCDNLLWSLSGSTSADGRAVC